MSPWGLYGGPGTSYFLLKECPPGVSTGTNAKGTSPEGHFCASLRHAVTPVTVDVPRFSVFGWYLKPGKLYGLDAAGRRPRILGDGEGRGFEESGMQDGEFRIPKFRNAGRPPSFRMSTSRWRRALTFASSLLNNKHFISTFR